MALQRILTSAPGAAPPSAPLDSTNLRMASNVRSPEKSITTSLSFGNNLKEENCFKTKTYSYK